MLVGGEPGNCRKVPERGGVREKSGSIAFAMRSDVKYSLTDACENCTTFAPRMLIILTKVEQASRTAFSEFDSRRLG